jgi:hypothetical protein
MQRRRLFSILAIASSIGTPLLATRPAHAQGWLSDRRYTEGVGIKAGDFEIHPGVGGEIGADSNLFGRTYQNGFINGCPTACPEAAAVFRITPSIYLATLQAQRKEGDVNATPPTVNFRLGASATAFVYLGDQPVMKYNNGADNISGHLSAQVDVLPQRPFSVGFNAGYDRTLNPNVSGSPDVNFNRNILNVGAVATVTPGGGTLDWKLGYNGNFYFFDSSGSNAPFNNFQNTIFTRGSWRFTPKTAVIYDGNFAFVNYQQQSVAFNGLLDSTPLRSRLGLNGLIGSRFALAAFAGYGASFVQTQGNAGVEQYGFSTSAGTTGKAFPGVIGQLEAKFFLTANPAADQNPGSVSLTVSSIALGYNRDFSQSYLGSFYGSDRGYVKFAYFFGGRAIISVDGGVGAREYPQIFSHTGATFTPIGPTGGFTDLAFDANIFAEYRFSNTLGLNLTLSYAEEFSPNNVSLPSDIAGDPYNMNYRRLQAFLGFRWFM